MDYLLCAALSKQLEDDILVAADGCNQLLLVDVLVRGMRTQDRSRSKQERMFCGGERGDICEIVGDKGLKALHGMAPDGFPASQTFNRDLVLQLLLLGDHTLEQIQNFLGRGGNTEGKSGLALGGDNVGGQASLDGAKVQGGLSKVVVLGPFLRKK